MNMITALIVQAQASEREGDHKFADVLIKTSQMDEVRIPFDSLFREEKEVWNMITSRYGKDPEALMPFYNIHSGIIALFIRTELQGFFEMAMKEGLLNPNLARPELLQEMTTLMRLFIRKREEHGLPHINENFLKSSIPYAFNISLGYDVQTPIFEDRRSTYRGTPDRRSNDRKTGNLSRIKSIFYQPEIDEDQYISGSLSDLKRYETPKS